MSVDNFTFARQTRAAGFELDRVNLRVPTGLASSYERRLTIAFDYALDNGWHWFAMHKSGDDTNAWLVFRTPASALSVPVALRELPTREAAEMWLAHRDGE